jgi:hypothetical protein
MGIFIGGIPNLHLRNAAKIDAAIAFRPDQPINPQLEVAEILCRGEVRFLSVTD